MPLQEEIKKAVGAHGLWKMRLRSAIEAGASELVPEQVSKDNLCDFGKWLYGPSVPPAAKASAEYAACRQLHAEFHALTADILRLVKAGQHDRALAELESHSKFADVSVRLTSAMMKWMNSPSGRAS